MPVYGFVCENCEHSFDEFLSIPNREEPISKPCPKCSENKIRRCFDSYSQTIGSDHTYDANKATGGKWNALMGKMKNGIPKRFHKNLDIASSQKGRYWKG
jgi:putative FmdB family regulatory protein